MRTDWFGLMFNVPVNNFSVFRSFIFIVKTCAFSHKALIVILLLNHGGSDFQIRTCLFGICLFTRYRILSLTFCAYTSTFWIKRVE